MDKVHVAQSWMELRSLTVTRRGRGAWPGRVSKQPAEAQAGHVATVVHPLHPLERGPSTLSPTSCAGRRTSPTQTQRRPIPQLLTLPHPSTGAPHSSAMIFTSPWPSVGPFPEMTIAQFIISNPYKVAPDKVIILEGGGSRSLTFQVRVARVAPAGATGADDCGSGIL